MINCFTPCIPISSPFSFRHSENPSVKQYNLPSSSLKLSSLYSLLLSAFLTPSGNDDELYSKNSFPFLNNAGRCPALDNSTISVVKLYEPTILVT